MGTEQVSLAPLRVPGGDQICHRNGRSVLGMPDLKRLHRHFGALGGELQQALAAGTPVEAITVCKDAAPRIAAEVAAAQGLAIGRTSQRLRNPANTPPAWAAGYVASAAEEPACFAGPEGELGAAMPCPSVPVCETTLATGATRADPGESHEPHCGPEFP